MSRRKHLKPIAVIMLGFTLIETLFAMVLFALILAIGYQGMIATAESRNLIIVHVDRQQALRATHRTLENAVSANAQLAGGRKRLEIQLSKANNQWLAGSRILTLEIDRQGQLLARLDDASEATLLLDGLQDAGLTYIAAGDRFTNWTDTTPPQLVELSWLENGQAVVWRFVSQL